MRMMVVPLRAPRYGGRPRTLSHFALGQDDSDYLDTDYISDQGSFDTDVLAPEQTSATDFDYTEGNAISPVIPGVSTAGTPTFASSVAPAAAVPPILPTTGSSVSSAGIGPSLSEAASATSALTNLVQQLTSQATPGRATPCTTATGAAGTVSGSTCIATPTSTIIPGVPDWMVYTGLGLIGVIAVAAFAGKR